MAVLQLRNHIPISGPARREAADGSETDMRVSLGFEPAWFSRRFGIDFSESWHRDPYYRHQSLVKMKGELHRLFPSILYWNPDEKDDTWTLSGAYGAYVIPQVFGCILQYEFDRWPLIIERPSLSLAELANVDIDQLMDASILRDLDRQMDVLEAENGKIHGYPSWQGVLNNAFNIRGQDIFTDILMEPELTHQFLALIAQVMIRVGERIQERQRKSGFYVNHMSVSNCVVNLISPQHYREFVMPYDRKIAERFERFGVHTCNWNISPYAEDLSQLPKVGYIDMGLSSDMKRVKELFPRARRAMMYSPVRLQDASIEEIEQDLTKTYRELAPCDIVMADIQETTPDSRVQAFLNICHRLEESK
jgi:Uroporphyrinogen decarboxylase (URO-D)